MTQDLAKGEIDPNAVAWLKLWRDLGCGYGTIPNGDRTSIGLMIPTTSINAKMSGVPALPDTPPHLQLQNADQWEGAIRAMELLRARLPDLEQSTREIMAALLHAPHLTLVEPAGSA